MWYGNLACGRIAIFCWTTITGWTNNKGWTGHRGYLIKSQHSTGKSHIWRCVAPLRSYHNYLYTNENWSWNIAWQINAHTRIHPRTKHDSGSKMWKDQIVMHFWLFEYHSRLIFFYNFLFCNDNFNDNLFFARKKLKSQTKYLSIYVIVSSILMKQKIKNHLNSKVSRTFKLINWDKTSSKKQKLWK